MATQTHASETRMVKDGPGLYVIMANGRRLLVAQIVNAGHPAAAHAHARVLAALDEPSDQRKTARRAPCAI